MSTAFALAFAVSITGLATPESAILSAVISNAVVIIGLIPLALRGIAYRPMGAAAIRRRNLLIDGVAGVVVPFAGIRLIELLITAAGLA